MGGKGDKTNLFYIMLQRSLRPRLVIIHRNAGHHVEAILVLFHFIDFLSAILWVPSRLVNTTFTNERTLAFTMIIFQFESIIAPLTRSPHSHWTSLRDNLANELAHY